MNDEISRFLASINYNGDAFKDGKIEKVVLNKKSETFDVYIFLPKPIDISEINHLLMCAKEGINGKSKCHIYLSFGEIDMETIYGYLDYLMDEIIIDHPSLINVKKAELKLEGKVLTINVSSDTEKNELLSECPRLLSKMQSCGLQDYKVEVVVNRTAQENIKEEIANSKNTIEEVKESPVILGVHKDGEVTKII